MDVVIVAAKRTPIGSFNGSLASVAAHKLGAVAIEAVLKASGVAPGDVDEVILGHVLTAAAGQNPARQAAMLAGIPAEVPAYCVNMLCGSGLKAVGIAAAAIRAGDATVVVAGGQESMSGAPHSMHLRSGTRMGAATMVDTMMEDGLTDAFHRYHMGITAENVAAEYGVTREEQDAFAAASQKKAAAAQTAGLFDAEIAPVTIKSRKGETVVDKDEYIKSETTEETLSKLRPCFKTDGSGTVTAGNASGINDGAAALLLMSAPEALRRGLTPIARIDSFAQAGVAPALMGTGPIPAAHKALERAGWTIESVDVVESNEAFAAQGCAVMRTLGLSSERVNVCGGAIALGHPIGASGARVLVTLLHVLARRRHAQTDDALKDTRGLAMLCIGGGMGVAMCVTAL